jgi:metal-dependent amidase/aminoacylase/carboxypeptidase family protein
MNKYFLVYFQMNDLEHLRKSVQPRLVQIRREIHKNPELAYEEKNTSKLIVNELKRIGIKEIQTNIGKTGVVALIRGSLSGKTIAIRSDMDALPIQEENKTSYKSNTNGKMHACGHDGHIAIVLGVAYLLHSARKSIKGNVKLIFQPAEEVTPPDDGARLMIQEGVLHRRSRSGQGVLHRRSRSGQGVLQTPNVDAIIGLHLYSGATPGHISFKPGVVMSSIIEYTISLAGKEAHGSTPEKGISSILAASDLVLDFEEKVLDGTQEYASNNIGVIRGGTAMNVVPKETFIDGSFRSMSEKDQEQIVENIKEMCKKVAKYRGVKIKLELRPPSKLVINDSYLINLFSPIVKSVTNSYDQTLVITGSEDFGEYTEHIPGVFFFLGCSTGKPEQLAHSGSFDINEEVLFTGSLLLARCAMTYLNQ